MRAKPERIRSALLRESPEALNARQVFALFGWLVAEVATPARLQAAQSSR